MEDANGGNPMILQATRGIARRILTIGENRLDLLLVEAQEARERLLGLVMLGIGLAVAALLAGMAGSAAIVVAWWATSPALVLSVLAGVYATVAALCAWRMHACLHSWRMMSATIDQLRKDKASLMRCLA
jgi:uncharacterized membrane protein YqjE